MYDVIVIGAGAAGLMAAATAARNGKSVLLMEKMEKIVMEMMVRAFQMTISPSIRTEMMMEQTQNNPEII